MVDFSSMSVFFREIEVVKEGGRQEVEGAVFQQGFQVGAFDPESKHMMVAQAPEVEGGYKKGNGQSFFHHEVFSGKEEHRCGAEGNHEEGMVNDEEEVFSLEVVGVAHFGGHDKDIAQEGAGVAACQFFFNGDGGAQGFWGNFHQHGDGTEIMAAGYMGFVIGGKHFSIPGYPGIGTDSGEGQGVLVGRIVGRHRDMEPHPAASGEFSVRRGSFPAAVITEEFYGHSAGDCMFAVAGTMDHIQGIEKKEEQQDKGGEAEEAEGFPVCRIICQPLVVWFHFSTPFLMVCPAEHVRFS